MGLYIWSRTKDFNPRSYKRSDRERCFMFSFLGISIHAPTRGATMSGGNGVGTGLDFNPRSYKRSDRYRDWSDS